MREDAGSEMVRLNAIASEIVADLELPDAVEMTFGFASCYEAESQMLYIKGSLLAVARSIVVQSIVLPEQGKRVKAHLRPFFELALVEAVIARCRPNLAAEFYGWSMPKIRQAGERLGIELSDRQMMMVRSLIFNNWNMNGVRDCDVAFYINEVLEADAE